MYYEEQWIEGALCWRTSPDGAWTRYTANELAHRYESAEKRAADAQATVEALQRERDEIVEIVGCSKAYLIETLRAVMKVYLGKTDLQAALDAELEKVKGLHEITKVICTHCCEPMEIPSKAVLQTQLTQLQALVRALLDTWVNGRKIHDGIPMTLRQQIDATLDATTPATTKT